MDYQVTPWQRKLLEEFQKDPVIMLTGVDHSHKTHMAAVASLYQAYRLLEDDMPTGFPQDEGRYGGRSNFAINAMIRAMQEGYSVQYLDMEMPIPKEKLPPPANELLRILEQERKDWLDEIAKKL